MPPRYAYWTILVDNQPTAFRAGAKEDLLPTFNRLKAKSPSAVMMWFQNGKLWPSRVDAQEAMLARGEMGRRGDARQGGGFRERHKVGANFSSPRGERADRRERTDWTPKPASPQARKPAGSDKLDWKPKGTFTPAPKRAERPEWKSKGSFDRERKPDWKPKGSFDRKPEWKSKGSFDRDRKPDWKPRGKNVGANFSSPRGERKERGERPQWTAKPASPQARKPTGDATEKRKWVPKEEYKKSLGIEAKRDAKWRPGGAHRDPRQKYKDAKKAKWTKFKKTIRTKWEGKKGKS